MFCKKQQSNDRVKKTWIVDYKVKNKELVRTEHKTKKEAKKQYDKLKKRDDLIFYGWGYLDKERIGFEYIQDPRRIN